MTICPQEVVCALGWAGTLAVALAAPALVRVSVQVPPLSITSGRNPVPITFWPEPSQLTPCRVTGVTGRVSVAGPDGDGVGEEAGGCPTETLGEGEDDSAGGGALAVAETLGLGDGDGAPDVHPVTPATMKHPRMTTTRVVVLTTRTT